jgi:hypothetical protein
MPAIELESQTEFCADSLELSSRSDERAKIPRLCRATGSNRALNPLDDVLSFSMNPEQLNVNRLSTLISPRKSYLAESFVISLSHSQAGAIACFLRNTFLKSIKPDCDLGSSSLRGGTPWLM